MKNLTIDTKQGCFALAQELVRGPALFDDFGRPTEAVLRYTGVNVTQDSERCHVVGALRLLACSDREIARVVGCDVRSIPLMLQELERTGQIPAVKERVARLTGSNAERAQIALAGLLEKAAGGSDTIELAAMIKAVATASGINTQNLQLLTGGATEILEVRVGVGRKEIEEWMKSAAIEVQSFDRGSSDSVRNAEEKGANGRPDTGTDTEGGGQGVPFAGTGGGGSGGAGVAGDDGLTGSQNFEQGGQR